MDLVPLGIFLLLVDVSADLVLGARELMESAGETRVKGNAGLGCAWENRGM